MLPGFAAHDFKARGNTEENQPEHKVARLNENAFQRALQIIQRASGGDAQREATQKGMFKKQEGADIAPQRHEYHGQPRQKAGVTVFGKQ